MEALSEPDHVSVPDSTQSPGEPSAVSPVADTGAGTGSDGCDPCPLPPAADAVAPPAADDQLEISALDRNLAQLIDLSRLHGSLATSTRTRTLDSRLESHEASSSFDSTHSVAHSRDAVPISRPSSHVAASSAAEIDPAIALDRSLARIVLISDPLARSGSPAAPSSVDPPLTLISLPCERTAAHPFDANQTSLV